LTSNRDWANEAVVHTPSAASANAPAATECRMSEILRERKRDVTTHARAIPSATRSKQRHPARTGRRAWCLRRESQRATDCLSIEPSERHRPPVLRRRGRHNTHRSPDGQCRAPRAWPATAQRPGRGGSAILTWGWLALTVGTCARPTP